eukprot:gene35440-42957_t
MAELDQKNVWRPKTSSKLGRSKQQHAPSSVSQALRHFTTLHVARRLSNDIKEILAGNPNALQRRGSGNNISPPIKNIDWWEILSKSIYNFKVIWTSYYILMTLIFGAAIMRIDNIKFIDAYFLASSAMTNSGLATISMLDVSSSSFGIVAMLMIIGCPPFMLIITTCFRKYKFRQVQLKVSNYYFHHVEEKQRLKLTAQNKATISYYETYDYALTMLIVIFVEYFVLWMAFGVFIEYGTLFIKALPTELVRRGFNRFDHATFNVVSAFSNSGLTLTSDSLVNMADNPAAYVTLSIIILAGNTALPIFLRLLVKLHVKVDAWLTRWDPRRNRRRDVKQYRRALHFVLTHPRKLTTHLFDPAQTFYLGLMLLLFIVLQYVFFLASTLNRQEARAAHSVRQLLGIGYFQTLSTRTSGFAMLDLRVLSQGLLLVYVVMMYLSAFPLVTSIHSSQANQQRPAAGTAAAATSAAEPQEEVAAVANACFDDRLLRAPGRGQQGAQAQAQAPLPGALRTGEDRFAQLMTSRARKHRAFADDDADADVDVEEHRSNDCDDDDDEEEEEEEEEEGDCLSAAADDEPGGFPSFPLPSSDYREDTASPAVSAQRVRGDTLLGREDASGGSRKHSSAKSADSRSSCRIAVGRTEHLGFLRDRLLPEHPQKPEAGRGTEECKQRRSSDCSSGDSGDSRETSRAESDAEEDCETPGWSEKSEQLRRKKQREGEELRTLHKSFATTFVLRHSFMLLLAVVILAYSEEPLFRPDSPAQANLFRWANDGDVNSMDPYTRSETFLLTFNANIYEPLIRRDRNLRLEAALAERWEQADPLTWRFHLRRNVRFSDGTPFTADDVVFSIARARGPGSNITSYFAAVAEVRKVDDFTVDLITRVPSPILPEELTSFGIMSKAWLERNNSQRVADLTSREENFATRNAMGTGPFLLVSREPDRRT